MRRWMLRAGGEAGRWPGKGGVVELVDVAAEGAVVDEIAELPCRGEHEIGGGGAEGFTGEDAREERGAGGVAGVAAGADVERWEGHELSVEGPEVLKPARGEGTSVGKDVEKRPVIVERDLGGHVAARRHIRAVKPHSCAG